MRVIQRESNGNPYAVNNWDSNAKAGHPSMGLVQTIQPTFDSYAFPGHHNIFNGYDDLLAGIAYMAAKYGRGSGAFARFPVQKVMQMADLYSKVEFINLQKKGFLKLSFH